MIKSIASPTFGTSSVHVRIAAQWALEHLLSFYPAYSDPIAEMARLCSFHHFR